MGLAFLITADNLQLLSERKVLKAHEYAALLDAKAVLAEAQGEAHRLVEAGAEESDAHRRAGWEAGWAEAQAEFAARFMNQAWTQDAERHAQRVAIARLVVRAVERLLSELPPERLLAAALERVDTLLAGEPAVTMCVAPMRMATAEGALRLVAEEGRCAVPIRIVPDPELGLDDCRLVTLSGHIDIGLEAQVEAIRRSLLGDTAGAAA